MFLVCTLLLAAGACAAQQTASTPSSGKPAAASADAPQGLSPALRRKVEIMIRSELGVPPEYNMKIGPREKSQVEGYDRIPVTFFLTGEMNRAETLDFLLSKDGNTLARLTKWSMAGDPMAGLPIEGRPVRGNPQAKVTIVNFDDLECPFCARLHSEFFPDTLNRYKGLVKFIYVDYPLVSIHPWAMHAAVDANCLADQSGTAYWNYVDYVHTHGPEISGGDNNLARATDRLDQLAEQDGNRSGLNAGTLKACVEKQDDTKIREEMKAGDKLGVDATPTFFVNGERWSGILGEPQLWMMIDRALKAEGITPPPESPGPANHGNAAKGQAGQ